MNKHFTLVLFALFIFATGLLAKEVSKATAEKVAVNFFFQKSNQYAGQVDYLDLNIIDAYAVENAYYVINFEKGWVLVSAEDALPPVLGYNFAGNFPTPQNLDQNTKSWITYYVDEVKYVRENNLSADNNIYSQWSLYENTPAGNLNLRGDRDVDPLIDPIAWNQDDPWNMDCPEDAAGPGGHVYVGCVATAMSQILYYWRFPLIGHGQKQYYQAPYGVISANFDTTHYNWDGMKCSIDNRNIWDIALIGFHTGVSVQMDYSPEGSGAQSTSVPNALVNYFRYSSSTQYLSKSNYSQTQWENMMQANLDAGKPIYYSGFSSDGGHAFVCDGYQGSNYYHFNFGWSGYSNGYYTLQDVNGYNQSQGMVRNIYPGEAGYPYVASGADTLKFNAGSFTDGSGPVDDYPSGMNASWLIAPQTSTDSVSTISLHFVKFNTASSDHLMIYDGNSTSDPLIGDYSGSNIPDNLTINNKETLITFTSTGTAPGFNIEYTTTAPSWCNGNTVITDPYGTVTDGSENGFYYNNGATCIFIFQNPEAVKYNFEFNEFSTEEDNDKLTVYDAANNLMGEYSGSNLPDPLSITTNMVIMTWGTNATINDQGWSFDFTVDGVGVSENAYNNLNVYPNPTNGLLNINFDVEKANDVKVIISNINGQVVYQENINSLNGVYNNSIDLSRQAKGVYMLSIVSSKGKTVKKIVLQ
ncbi:MAG: hypothetical protein DRJ09_10320 [Bacteroidetes bacterium]|nr:MAG: hypothetical protein DRJ09_10320 [Bacteroidota bacterium]